MVAPFSFLVHRKTCPGSLFFFFFFYQPSSAQHRTAQSGLNNTILSTLHRPTAGAFRSRSMQARKWLSILSTTGCCIVIREQHPLAPHPSLCTILIRWSIILTISFTILPIRTIIVSSRWTLWKIPESGLLHPHLPAFSSNILKT